jgi:short-subunit dehydrogenase involved in D-alanine esterification of teichoic acids
VVQNYELAKECVETNFIGAKRVTEALLPLLQLSTSPRIVNVSSRCGQLKVKLTISTNLNKETIKLFSLSFIFFL